MMIELMTTNYVLVSSPDNLSQRESLRVTKIGQKSFFVFDVEECENIFMILCVFEQEQKKKKKDTFIALRHKNDK